MKFVLSILLFVGLLFFSQSLEVENSHAKPDLSKLTSTTEKAGAQTYKHLVAEEGKSFENKLKIDGSEDDNNLIQRIIQFIARIVGAVGIFALVIGGYFMIISNGDEQKLSKGKNIVMYTVAGLLLAFLSYIIVQYVLSIIFGL